MEDPFHFVPINLDNNLDHFVFDSLESKPNDFTRESWQYNSQQRQYNFLQSSLCSDLKVQKLEEDLVVKSSPTPPVRQDANSGYALPLPTSLPVKPEQTDTKAPPRKKRKRNDDEETGTSDVSFVKLSRDQLLVMSSYELEERVKYLQQQRPLSTAENEEIKRQRKLIKNREYAQTSRLKKRETLSTLKGQLGEVSLENEILKTQVNHLNQRVQYLEQENNQLRSLLVQPPAFPQFQCFTASVPVSLPVPVTSYPSSPESSTYSEVGSPTSVEEGYDPFLMMPAADETLDLGIALNSGNSPKSGITWSTNPYAYTQGLCLLVILFSFGLFFNAIPGLEPPVSRSTARALFEFGNSVMDEDNAEELLLGKNKGNDTECRKNSEIYFPETDDYKMCPNETSNPYNHRQTIMT